MLQFRSCRPVPVIKTKTNCVSNRCSIPKPPKNGSARLAFVLYAVGRIDSSKRDSEEVEHALAQKEELCTDDENELMLPSKRHQSPIDMKTIKELRTKSNTMAKDKTIQRIICGQNGITQTFLNACADILVKHSFLRVKLGEGSGLDRGEAAQTLEQYLDAIAVHEVGFTITLYREPGLPRPSNCPSSVSNPDESDSIITSTADGVQETKESDQKKISKSAQRSAAAKAAAKKLPKGPPEFSIV